MSLKNNKNSILVDGNNVQPGYKKRVKYNLVNIQINDTTLLGAVHASWTMVPFAPLVYFEVYKPVYMQLPWQDPSITKWEAKKKGALMKRLRKKYQWYKNIEDIELTEKLP